MPQDRDLRLKPLQVPLMYAFRAAAEARDSKRAERIIDQRSDARVLTERGSIRRRGANESELKRNLDIDLSNLVNTVNLGSIVDLAGMDRVRGSVLNFGVQDITHLTSDSVDRAAIVDYLRDALLAHEPRLIGATLAIQMRDEVDEVNQRIAFAISAEMACRPVDIPLEFVAELDMGSGKVRLSNLAERG